MRYNIPIDQKKTTALLELAFLRAANDRQYRYKLSSGCLMPLLYPTRSRVSTGQIRQSNDNTSPCTLCGMGAFRLPGLGVIDNANDDTAQN